MFKFVIISIAWFSMETRFSFWKFHMVTSKTSFVIQKRISIVRSLINYSKKKSKLRKHVSKNQTSPNLLQHKYGSIVVVPVLLANGRYTVNLVSAWKNHIETSFISMIFCISKKNTKQILNFVIISMVWPSMETEFSF